MDKGGEGGLGATQQAFVGVIQSDEHGVTRIRHGIHALAQGGRRGHSHQAERRLEEGILAQRFDGVEVGLAGAQQPHASLDQAAGIDTALTGNGEARVDDLVDPGMAFEVLPDQRQSGMRGQVAGQAFDLEIGHGGGNQFNAAIIS